MCKKIFVCQSLSIYLIRGKSGYCSLVILLLFTPFTATRFAMHRNYVYCIISCVDCLGIFMHKLSILQIAAQLVY